MGLHRAATSGLGGAAFPMFRFAIRKNIEAEQRARLRETSSSIGRRHVAGSFGWDRLIPCSEGSFRQSSREQRLRSRNETKSGFQ